MKSFAQKRPIVFGIVFTIAVLVGYLAINALLYSLVGSSVGSAQGKFIDTAVKAAFFIPAAILLGFLIKGNGFGHTFSAKGFGRGLIAAIPVFLCLLPIVVIYFNAQGARQELLPDIPAIIAQQAATGLFEETLFRGLLLTAFLIRWGGSAGGRVLAALVSAVPFGAIHILNIFFGMEVQDALLQALVAMAPGIMFAAVYVFSKSLLLCVILHAVWDVFMHGLELIVRQANALEDAMNLSADWAIMAVGPLLAIVVIVLARPFRLSMPDTPTQGI